jgi:hypothetical protein
MLTLYILCLVIGGVFVALAAFAGLDGVDFESDFDPDIELRDQSNSSHNPENSPFRRSRSLKLGLPFLSLRFWTFGSCFFGLTGVILSWLTPTYQPYRLQSLRL